MIPASLRVLKTSPYTRAPMTAVSAVPTPDQIAYAKLNGRVFKHKDKQ